MTIKRFIIGLMVGYAVILFAANAKAEDLTIQRLNAIIDQTNFIVDDGCSGTLIGDPRDGLVLTAHHCIDGKIRWIEKDIVEDGEVKKKKVEIRQPIKLEQKVYSGTTQVGGAQYMADIVAYSDVRTGYDLALLKIKADRIPMTIGGPMLPIGREAMRAERVYVIGNPAMLDASVTEGIIVSVTREYKSPTGNKVQMLQTSAEVFFGNSGGVLLSADGYYLGTVSRGRPGTAIIFAMHYNHIREMLKENCYAELYDPKAESHDDCVANKKTKAEAESETVKSLLKKLVDQTAK